MGEATGRPRSLSQAQARLDPRLETVQTEILGGPLDRDRREVSRTVGVSVRTAEKFWKALGFPVSPQDDTVFSRYDLDAIGQMAALVRSGQIDEDTALGLTRAFARTADRLSVWQCSVLAEFLSPWAQGDVELRRAAVADEGHDSTRAEPDEATAIAAAEKVAELADALEPLLVYAWRRHLAAATARMVADADPTVSTQGLRRCVGFADLVSFTSLVRRLSERELAQVVQRFEALCSDVITTHRGRVIKTVGDEVLFVTKDPVDGARLALDLVDEIRHDELLPPVRVGLAHGKLVSRLGDVFGDTVNRAARLTAVAPSGKVLVDDHLASLLTGVPELRTARQRTRTLRGVGVVTPSLLQRAVPASTLDALRPAIPHPLPRHP
ncbi:adenylate/guanylate cyclase domain-containing protein [Arsenicicoccus dermatophilus]|uniref:adenylate/guanylate cyclase domain-containing protein n=1 Tax=Arsenicicoccus dermatophilus TaxID=1076331 RepID=UPI001F4D0995|nr:adenylate/guanylate cyclase domain-containing protein [Arsenicicoccus dermatophilus]MCH8612293.1 adenylate/guanylate cyclase domain-containing protein [Arsenicicoccus dermatophilus]